MWDIRAREATVKMNAPTTCLLEHPLGSVGLGTPPAQVPNRVHLLIRIPSWGSLQRAAFDARPLDLPPISNPWVKLIPLGCVRPTTAKLGPRPHSACSELAG
jgi:hypothetical protein